MFLFPNTREYLRSLEADRERKDRAQPLLRELRGATPPFGGAITRRLAAAMAALAGDGTSGRAGRVAAPCPDVKEAMSS